MMHIASKAKGELKLPDRRACRDEILRLFTKVMLDMKAKFAVCLITPVIPLIAEF
jgi:hypothetical protein